MNSESETRNPKVDCRKDAQKAQEKRLTAFPSTLNQRLPGAAKRSEDGSTLSRNWLWLVLILTQLSTLNPQLSLHAQQTNCTPPPSGLVAWWPGDGFALDVVGTNHSTLENGAGYAPGLAGRCFSFDGVEADVLVPHSDSLTPTNGLTMVAWIKSSGSPSYSGIIRKNNSTSTAGYQMGLHNNGTIRTDLGIGTSYITAYNAKPVLNGQWHLVATTYDRTNALVFVDAIPGVA